MRDMENFHVSGVEWVLESGIENIQSCIGLNVKESEIWTKALWDTQVRLQATGEAIYHLGDIFHQMRELDGFKIKQGADRETFTPTGDDGGEVHGLELRS
jgi:hypothetical protein